MSSLQVLGVRVDDVTVDEAVETIARFVEERTPRQIATINPEFVMAARRQPEFKSVLNAADLCVPDGVGLTWGSWLLRRPLRGRVPGVDLVWRLAGLAADRDWSMFLLGGFEGVGPRTGERLRERHPSLRIAGTYEGHPADPLTTERVRAAQPDLLLVAYGAPAQDLWIAGHKEELGVPVAIGVGGSFDFIAGRAKRAPDWLRRLGLEWLHRLVHEPWRWRRMLALPKFAILVLRQRWTS
ncbi:MAG TPA: WecB/TagA/CpsF family glycosyltransferase [Chloroflexota bacterium]|jgi:N-acetylglucosaminyldiphosphoundecaprenol N-acetyl-beta-D-mannosaminyltransferase